MYLTCNSINHLLSYCGLVDARISDSEKDIPVLLKLAQTKLGICNLPDFTSQKTLTGGNPENGPSGLI